ncbi:hypothetical protein CR162_09410 [Pseudoroseomonas rhizosphaerae]|uniref:Alpha/beta hydrolase n=1 Tax=Teichococcus rhizosphaerae TaxID=1335062 RepID=A0A2C6Y342_9PROT|nr:hypothetical protein [Pseudoroseomonas rhizosphaerae]PHK95222.1 hypothetical protein CR162_09410 [Pseudoroseomonas rhizosphaerae]
MASLVSGFPRPRLLSFGDYEGEYGSSGAATHLVVALTGVGDVREPLKSYDFYRTLTNRPQADHLLLRDQSRSWFHNPAGRDALIDACQDIIGRGGYRLVTFLGISMGAYGALSLGRLFPGARILAMSPPFSLDTARHGRNVVRHKRWLDANSLHGPTDLDAAGENEHLVLFGDAEPIDILNLQRFQAAGFPGLFVCPGGDHNIGATLQRQRRMALFMDMLTAGAPLAELAAILGAYPAFEACHAVQMLRARAHLYRGEMAEADHCLNLARWAVGEGSPNLALLSLLRLGLGAPQGEGMAAAAREADRLPGRGVTVPLEEGWELSLKSSEARQTGNATTLGPLVLGRLRRTAPGPDGPCVLSFRAEAPQTHNAAGRRTLEVFGGEAAGYPLLLAAEPSDARIGFPLELRGGEAEFVLRRACFASAFDEKGSDDQFAWATRLREPRLGA